MRTFASTAATSLCLVLAAASAHAADRIVISPYAPRPWARADWLWFSKSVPPVPVELTGTDSLDFVFAWPDVTEASPASADTKTLRFREEIFHADAAVREYHARKHTASSPQWVKGHSFKTEKAELELLGWGVSWPESWDQRGFSATPTIQYAWTGPGGAPSSPEVASALQNHGEQHRGYGKGPSLHIAAKSSVGAHIFGRLTSLCADADAQIVLEGGSTSMRNVEIESLGHEITLISTALPIWHPPRLLLGLTMTEGAPEEIKRPLVSGLAVNEPKFKGGIVAIWDGEWIYDKGYRDLELSFTKKRDEGTTVLTCDWPPLGGHTERFFFIRLDNEPNLLTASVERGYQLVPHGPLLLSWHYVKAPRKDIRGVTWFIPKNGRPLIFDLGKLPGFPEQNRNLEDLRDVWVPGIYAETWRAMGVRLCEMMMMSTTFPFRSDYSFRVPDYPNAFIEPTTARVLLDSWLRPIEGTRLMIRPSQFDFSVPPGASHAPPESREHDDPEDRRRARREDAAKGA